MGVVRRQSVVSTIFIFAGFLIGAVNIFFFYGNENYFTHDQFGLTRLLPDVALIFSASCTFGGAIALVKFYPFYNSYLTKEKNDLPVIGLVACIIGCLLFVVVLPFCKDFFVRKFSAKSALFTQYFNLLYPYVTGLAFFTYFEACHWAIRQSVLPNVLKELVFRVISLVLILFLVFRLIDFDKFILLYSMLFPAMALIMLVNLIKNKFFVFNPISSVTKRLGKRIIQFTVFIFMGSLLHIAATVIGIIVLASQGERGLGDVAVFTIATYLVTLMDIPLRSMTGIASTIIAQAWKDKDLKRIDNLYTKTALTLLIAGLFILGLVLLNANNIASFLGKNYAGIYYIILVLGISKLIDLGSGLNAQILLSSRYWKIDFYTQLVLVVLMLFLNYFLIKKFGIMGSAYASLISFLIYNFLRFYYIKRLFNFQPFSIMNVYALLLGAVCFTAVWFIPFIANIYIDSIIKTTIFSLLFAVVFYRFKISADINRAMEVYIDKFMLITGLRKKDS
jgi:O-antigen/teichoic acid export membrane protein